MAIRNHIHKDAKEIRYEQDRVERIKKYIADNLQTDLSAAVVSKKFELSISSLQHIFKKYQHQSCQHYIERIRMTKALALVKEGERTKEIMNAMGYRYRSTFNKAFKKRFQHTPSYFRR